MSFYKLIFLDKFKVLKGKKQTPATTNSFKRVEIAPLKIKGQIYSLIKFFQPQNKQEWNTTKKIVKSLKFWLKILDRTFKRSDCLGMNHKLSPFVPHLYCPYSNYSSFQAKGEGDEKDQYESWHFACLGFVQQNKQK